jgi:hypothetical protein
MNFQERLIEATSVLATRAGAFATTALDAVRERADGSVKRLDAVKGSLGALGIAGRELRRVARRHASRFVKQNSALAKAAGSEFGTIARATYASLARARQPAKSAARARKPRAAAARRRASTTTA